MFHVNGYRARPFNPLAAFAVTDAQRMFLNDGHAHFTDVESLVGLSDTAHTTSTVCADLDLDGDVDIVTLEVDGVLRAYE